ncbi:LapA family protein [Xylella taiwanensis]|uniref:LapA family protein n=1 Tax=Xylella taiwanensis TaxID=1444770 RepID=Z9JJB0_9GAMM|nr:LapA family protein [Xylella taiwanensis]AXI83208.1 membrane protein [Xylella taiwanensis]EWS77926.1 membrane protein [Xylella taiwanensis]MCD8456261.1 LapA family protein [Xylella taiwanensis]MCD8458669.1 LapA family protein [Xylella taiwanensis]MCD8460804.1 LapA family protein [Xylella taiwanensis]
MKIFRLLVMLVFLLVGLVIGVLNSAEVTLDFMFSSVRTTLGMVIVVALLAGLIIGSSLVFVVALIPTYSKLRRTNKVLAQMRSASELAADLRPTDGLH